MDQNNQPVPMLYNQSSISLPLNENAFKEFIVSLLGQPETIEGYVEGAFEIDMGGLEYLDSQIDSRIDKQNVSSLLEFRVKLFFNDGSSTSFNGLQSFLGYNEIRPLICEGFMFTWTYLVKFNNKQVSEKQEISISSLRENILEAKKTKRRKIFLDIEALAKAPKINYSIRCTDKDWGIEIIELIRRCSSKFIKVSSSSGINFRRKIVENFELVEFFCMFLGLVLSLVMIEQLSALDLKTCNDLSSQADQYMKGIISLERKIDFLTKLVSSCNSKRTSFSIVFPIGSIFFSTFIVPVIIYKIIQLPNYRFLLFTEESKKERDEYFRNLADRKTFWIVTVLVGLIIGLLGNYIFTFLSNIFVK